MFETLEDMREKSPRPRSRGTALFMYSFDLALGLFLHNLRDAKASTVSGSRRCRRVPAVFDLVGFDHSIASSGEQARCQGSRPNCDLRLDGVSDSLHCCSLT